MIGFHALPSYLDDALDFPPRTCTPSAPAMHSASIIPRERGDVEREEQQEQVVGTMYSR